MEKYRIFISYSHKDLELVKKIVGILEENGLMPMWDKNFIFGHGFHEQIQSFIAHAHIFLPVITGASMKRGWVHQEIGYAMALNIPVLPVTRGALPGEMIQQLQAITLGDQLEEMRQQLSRDVFDGLVNSYRDLSLAHFQCAELAEDRALTMVRYANDVIKLGVHGCVRQRGGLSSFHIPDKVITDPVWKQRYNPDTRGEFHCRCQRNERIALEKHARNAGCRLIINPCVLTGSYSIEAQTARLQTLADFLESMPDGKVQVAVNDSMPLMENLTMVDDWFAAESVSRSIRQGYRQTIFTRHAPSMQHRRELFDQELEELQKKTGWRPETSRRDAIGYIENIMRMIKG